MLVLLYTTYIIKGLKKFRDVPDLLKDDVKQALIDADMEHLAN